MLNYAEDLDIAPMELMVVVRAVTPLTLGLQSANGAPSHVYLMSDILWRRAHLVRMTAASPAFVLVQTSAISPMFITPGGLFPLALCV
jgi:hypothetical protein